MFLERNTERIHLYNVFQFLLALKSKDFAGVRIVLTVFANFTRESI